MDVYLYCSDRTKQKDIKDEIERDTGVTIRRVVRSIDTSKDYGVGIIIIDDMLDLDIEFKSSDILVTLRDMEFTDWLYLIERGIEVVKCEEGYSNLKWALRIRGADGAEDLDSTNSGRVVTKKASIKDYFTRYSGGIHAFYSVESGVGKSTLVYNAAKTIKSQNPSKRVVIIDRVKQFSSINYLVNNNSRFEKVAGVVENLYKDRDTDVFVYSPNSPIKIIKNTGITDIVNVLDNMKKHFDYILIDTDNLFDTDIMDILELSNHTYIVTEDSTESIDKSLKLLDNTFSKINKATEYTIVINKHTGNTPEVKISYGKVYIPFIEEIAKESITRIYTKDSNNLEKAIQYMYHISGQFELDQKQIAQLGQWGV